jgi:hypothetical protein
MKVESVSVSEECFLIRIAPPSRSVKPTNNPFVIVAHPSCVSELIRVVRTS